MGCGASTERPPPRPPADPVARARAGEEARVAPLLLRMETITDLHKEGLMTDAEYEKHRRDLVAEIAGGGGAQPSISEQKMARLRRAEEERRWVDQMLRQMASAPDTLPKDYWDLAGRLPPKFTREVAEQEEWRNARSGPMQEYYNPYAGVDIDTILADKTTRQDGMGNPIGTQYDLPRDGTMQEHTLVILWFSAEGTYGKPVDALVRKGFKVIVHNAKTSTVQQMMVSLLSADVAWLVSGSSVAEGFDHLLDALESFHRRGGGIFVWGDNAPFFAHANQLLVRLFPGEGVHLLGNDQGSQIMRAGPDGAAPGCLTRSHLIMTGLHSLFEGVTISYLSRVGPLKVLATYNDGQGYHGQAYCAVADAEVYRRCKAAYKMGRGRLVIDGGFTKLYDEFWSKTAGTERYVKNATAWLLNMNSRILSEGEGAAAAATRRVDFDVRSPAQFRQASPTRPQGARSPSPDRLRNGMRTYRNSAGPGPALGRGSAYVASASPVR